MEAGLSSVCVFLDLAKALDSVPHQCIVDALSKAGVMNPLLGWFRNYLTNRSQFMAMEGLASSCCNVASEVPQRSILGPLLFTLTSLTFKEEAVCLDMLMMSLNLGVSPVLMTNQLCWMI